MNADGLSDIVIGTPAKSTTASFSGRAYVVFGTASTANVSLSDVAVGAGGFIIDGAAASDSAGVVVDVLRDINADGLDDVAVACDRHLGSLAAAATHVVFGKTSTGPVSLATIPAGTEGLTRLEPRAPFDYEHGMATSPAGDVDADGFDDFVLGPPLSENGYVVFGANFTGAVTLRGTKAADTLAATNPVARDVLVGDLGWDTLSSDGGGDILLAGKGNDRLRIASADFARIDGGGDIDTLQLVTTGMSLTLAGTDVSKFASIERIDARGAGDNPISIDVVRARKLPDGGNTLTVLGEAGDTVTVIVGSATRALVSGFVTYSLPGFALRVQNTVTIIES